MFNIPITEIETPEINFDSSDMITYSDILESLNNMNNKLNNIDEKINKLIELYTVQNNI